MATVARPNWQSPNAQEGIKEYAFSSRVIQHIRYELPAGQIYGSLIVTFKSGAQHQYFYVPPFLVDMFLEARSKGSFFSQAIKGKYASHRIVDKRTGPPRHVGGMGTTK